MLCHRSPKISPLSAACFSLFLSCHLPNDQILFPPSLIPNFLFHPSSDSWPTLFELLPIGMACCPNPQTTQMAKTSHFFPTCLHNDAFLTLVSLPPMGQPLFLVVLLFFPPHTLLLSFAIPRCFFFSPFFCNWLLGNDYVWISLKLRVNPNQMTLVFSASASVQVFSLFFFKTSLQKFQSLFFKSL